MPTPDSPEQKAQPDRDIDKKFDAHDFQQTGASPGLVYLLSASSVGLLLIYFISFLFEAYPVRLLDPLWIIETSGFMVNSVSIPIVGVLLFHVAAGLDSYNNRIQLSKRFISRLSAFLSVLFLLLVPLLAFASWRGYANVSQGSSIQARAINAKASSILNAIQGASSSAELQTRMLALQGPSIENADINSPLPTLKANLARIVLQTRGRLLASLPKPDADAFKTLYRQALRAAVLALISSLSFAALSWDPLKQESLLQSFFNKRRAPGLQPAKLLAPLRSLLAFLAQPFRRNRSSEDRRRFWSEVKNRDKRASALRAKEIKRNAAKIRKLKLDRERQRRQRDRERQRQERRDRKRQQDEER